MFLHQTGFFARNYEQSRMTDVSDDTGVFILVVHYYSEF